MKNNKCYRRIGTMIDCSRNAVMNVESVKKWIDITADLGFNTVMLYMEDTYEVNNNPYFGYGRGRYSKKELKEINAYAIENNMELIPCIQTLAHLNTIKDWPKYCTMMDCNDILLIGDERVYELIDDMFASLSECLTTKHINIGMDEAEMVGRGRYYTKNGERKKIEILLEHVNRVSEIGRKYGFTLSMWSDMFFKLASGGSYYNVEFDGGEEIKKLIPDNVELVYWDYYSKDEKRYDDMLKAHHKISDSVWFAGGIWTWRGFAPLNQFTIDATSAALSACEKNNIMDVFFTMWGDDGGECSKFTTLPSLFYISEYINGNRNLSNIKDKFEKKYGIPFDKFMLFDLTSNGRDVNPSKYILYNDLFNGKINTLIKDDTAEEYRLLSRKLSLLKGNDDWGYLFETMSNLAKVVSIKAALPIKIREAYSRRDIEGLKLAISECKRLKKMLVKFYNSYRNQWMKENKGQGFDVQDLRLGGTIVRTEHCAKRLQDLVDGKITKIEELDEPLLDYFGKGTEYNQHDANINLFRFNYTSNVISH